MAVPDFSKIFSSNSPLTRYTWTDSDYLTGWQTVGGTPPARTQFDALQFLTDTKLKYLYDYYAPLNSPSFSGTPKAPTPPKSDNSTRIATTAWGQQWVSTLQAAINDAQGDAEDAQSAANNIVGITAASLGASGYVKFKNGLMIQWGTTPPAPNLPAVAISGPYNFTFPISFSSACFALAGSDRGPDCLLPSFVASSKSGGAFFLYNVDVVPVGEGVVAYIAVGV